MFREWKFSEHEGEAKMFHRAKKTLAVGTASAREGIAKILSYGTVIENDPV
jgi:hypothetical protein